MAIYLGHSPNHASTVPLILNIRTGLVSPQYHIIYDDQFMTTSCLQTNTLPTHWNELFKQQSENYLAGESALQEKHTLGSEWADPQTAQQSERAKRVTFVDEVKARELGAAEGAAPTARTEGEELQREDLHQDLNAEAVAITDPPE